MADLLGEVDTNVVPLPSLPRKSIKSENRRKVRVLSPPLSQQKSAKRAASKMENSPPSGFDDDDMPLPGAFEDDNPMSDPAPSSPMAKAG